MNEKDYVAFAAVLRDAWHDAAMRRDTHLAAEEMRLIERIARRLAHVCAVEDSSFDTARFLAASMPIKVQTFNSKGPCQCGFCPEEEPVPETRGFPA